MSIRVRAGIVSASSTPAIVAWTPDCEERRPEAEAEQRVDGRVAHAEAIGRDERERANPHDQRRRPGDRCAGVEERDHQHRAEVVDDGERGQEDLQAVGTREPSSASTPSAKAMSVAIGMPQPRQRRRRPR